MHITNCALVIKQTAFQKGGRAAHFAHKGDATAQRILHAHDLHERTLETARTILTKRKIPFTEISVKDSATSVRRALSAADFVMTIGGDGTVLHASHFVREAALLGVNSAPGDSVGHFCHANGKNLKAKLQQILSGEWQPTLLARLAVMLDEKPLPELALNDALIAHDCPAATTRYLIRAGHHEEEHRSSGLWVATAAGSTAAIHSAGGRILPRQSKNIQYLVRELYREPGREYQLLRGLLRPGEQLHIASKMPEAHLYIDGARTKYQFPFGTRAVFDLAQSPLHIFLTPAAGR
jgi:NAD+ kinase